MTLEAALISALIIGLLGSTHCIGMCGGIISTLSISLGNEQKLPLFLGYQLSYNIGRITSYAVAGGIAGGIGAQFLSSLNNDYLFYITTVISSAFMFALGFYLTGWTAVLAPIEKMGGTLWRRLEPLGRRFLPPKTPLHAFLLGAVWGWLPCGMVYSVLILALSVGDPIQGALILSTFGLATLPTLLLVGSFAHRVNALLKRPWVRMASGGIIIFLACINLYSPIVSQMVPSTP